MTESIFVPFRLTTEDSIEKAVKVLTGEPTPWPEYDGDEYRIATPKEEAEFDEWMMKNHLERTSK